MPRRRRAGRKRNLTAERHPGGGIVRGTTLPPPEVIARRGANWKDQDAGDIFGIMQARGMLPDKSGERVNGVPGPTPRELKVAGQRYADLVARYERTIGAPRLATLGEGGRTVNAEDVERSRNAMAKMTAAKSVLRDLDPSCSEALEVAITAATHEEIEKALPWSAWIALALEALHHRADDIRSAGYDAKQRRGRA